MRFLFLVLSLVLVMSEVSEAGGKRRQRVFQRQSMRCTSGSCRSVYQYQYRSEVIQSSKGSGCVNGVCPVPIQSSAAPVTSGWQSAAELEAGSGFPTTHVMSAADIARVAGYPGASVFVGVGYNGQTCMGSGRLVAETTNPETLKTVRIWVR